MKKTNLEEACNTAVLLLVFNRPETTRCVFLKIREAKPRRLYIAADGQRPGIDGEAELCRKVREISTAVDWDCEVKTRFLEENQGCKLAVSSAISWFFENEEYGIILEDDCLPDGSFFQFCGELLERYRDDSRIMMISGTNIEQETAGKNSYDFSRYPHIWGWATWRRAWQFYDDTMNAWPQFRQSETFRTMFDGRTSRYWRNVFDRAYENRINSWASVWALCYFVKGGLSIFPASNLVSNIGNLAEGTHTNIFFDTAMGSQLFPLAFPLIHPDKIKINEKYDLLAYKKQNPIAVVWFVRIFRYLAYALVHKDISFRKVLGEVYGKVRGRLYLKK